MTPARGDIVVILQAICRVDLRGQYAVVEHMFDDHGVRWLVLVPWLESWPVDHVILQPSAVDIVTAAPEGSPT